MSSVSNVYEAESALSNQALTVYCMTSFMLTGSHDTRELPKITNSAPVTVTVARTVAPGSEDKFRVWATRLLQEASRFDGYLGGTVLEPGSSDNEFHIVTRFDDALSLRVWERSDVRQALLNDADGLIESARVAVAVGNDTFFQTAPTAKRFHRAFLTDIAWVLPVSFAFGFSIAPLLMPLHWAVRTAASSIAFTAVMRLGVMPARRILESRRSLA